MYLVRRSHSKIKKIINFSSSTIHEINETAYFRNFGVFAKNISISGSNMNRVLRSRISFDELWLALGNSVTTGRFDFSVSLNSRQKQKHPPSIELETQCNVGQNMTAKKSEMEQKDVLLVLYLLHKNKHRTNITQPTVEPKNILKYYKIAHI